MFRYLAENISFILIKNKILDIGDREIYVYSIETLLMNLVLLTIISSISILNNGILHLVGFLVFFLPLRMFAGGYHTKHSETCFVLTIGVYVGTLWIAKKWPLLYMNKFAIWIFIIAGIFIVSWSPLKNPQHLLSEEQYSRNRKRVFGFVIADFILFEVFCKYNCKLASSELVVVILFVGVLGIGKLVHYLENTSGN